MRKKIPARKIWNYANYWGVTLTTKDGRETHETWKTVPFARNYVVSEFGEVARNMANDGFALLKQRKNDEGYLKIKLVCDDGKRRDFFVHLLVLTCFAMPPTALIATGERVYGCHKKGKTDNARDNLYWGTHAENHADKVAAGTHRNGCVRKLTAAEVGKIRESMASVKRLAKQYGLSLSHVRDIRNGRRHAS